MKNIYNINNIPNQYISKFQGAKTMYVGNAVGSEKIICKYRLYRTWL